MNDTYIVASYVVIDDILKAYGLSDDCRASGTAAEVLTVGVVAAKYFQNHHEQALWVMTRLSYVHGLSVSRFNRRLHALRDWLEGVIRLVAALSTQGEIFLIDSMPLPVCRRTRASRCKKEKFFGWRLHLICTPDGVPVSFDLLPASEQDLTPIHELTVSLPDAATIFAETGVRFVAVRRRNMTPNAWADDYDLRLYRKRIETVYSQLEAMGIQHLHACTNSGFDLKVYASLLALAFTNLIPD